MKVLMIGGDKNMLDPMSEAGKRFALQRSAVDELDLFVWPQVHRAGEIFRAARLKQYDIVTAQDPFWRGLVALRAARLSGAKLNLQAHVDLASLSLVRHVLAQILLRHADSVRVVSEKIRGQVERMGVRAPIRVLPVYLNLALYQTLAHRRHPRYFRTILWIGRFEPEKNPLVALEILAAARKAGIDACLIMLGDGSLRRALEHASQEYKKCVEFPGYTAPAAYLAMADVVVSTSEYESYGASIVEALAAGVPVVSPDYGIAREAGATVVPRHKLVEATLEILRTGKRGSLQLPVLEASEWVAKWRESLL